MTICEEYEVIGDSYIGKGEDSYVYKVQHQTHSYVCALRVLRASFSANHKDNYNAVLCRYYPWLNISEARHPNIQRVYTPKLKGTTACFEMDYIEGVDLCEYLNNHMYLPISEVISFMIDISSSLAFCHSNNSHLLSDYNTHTTPKRVIIHNDIHSKNILREDSSGKYILADLASSIYSDVAKHKSESKGVIEYLAPEYSEMHISNTQTDIYSFGILAYEVLCGKLPFEITNRDSPLERQHLISQHKYAPIPSIYETRKKAFQKNYTSSEYFGVIPNWLVNIINKCLEKDPANRYFDAEELHKDIVAKKESYMPTL